MATSVKKFNPNPSILIPTSSSKLSRHPKLESFLLESEENESVDEDDCPIDEDEIFDLIRNILDPEHPTMTLEQLAVVKRQQIEIKNNRVFVEFTPTTPACGMTSVIGLTIVARLLQSLPPRMRIQMSITPGSYNQAKQVSKQLNDKERVAAAMEAPGIMNEINRCLAGC